MRRSDPSPISVAGIEASEVVRMRPDSLFMVQVPVPAMRETRNWMGRHASRA